MTVLEEIKKALEGVGPLKVEFTPDCDEFNAIIAPINDDYDGTFFTVIGCGDKQDKLGGFMAIAVNAVPELLSTLESLQRENEALKNLIDGDNCADPDKIDALFRRAEAAEAEVARLQAEIDRTERNRDMWKGQVERQAESLSKFREEEIRLRETLFKCGSFIADRYQEGDPEYQVVLLVNSAICGKPALASAGGLS